MRPRIFPVVLAGATAFIDLYATQPLLPLLMRVFGASTFAVSLTITASTIGVAVAAPFVGRFADRTGRKRVIVGATIGLAVSTALAATATSLAQLIVWRFVQGLFTPGVFAVTIAYIHEEWPRSRAGAATAAYVSGTVAGGFSGRFLSGLIAADESWRAAFLVLAGLNLAAAVALWIWLPRERRQPQKADGVRHGGALLRHLRNPQLITTYAVGFCVLFTIVTMFTYVTFRLAAPPFSLSSAALGSIFFVYLIGAAITPFAGRGIDAYGHRAALTSAMALGAVGALATLPSSLAGVVVGLTLCASGVFIAQAAASSHVAVAAEHDRGLAIGLYATFYYVGGSTGAALPAVAWNLGGWPACVALVIAVQLAVVLIALSFWPPGGRREERQEAILA